MTLFSPGKSSSRIPGSGFLVAFCAFLLTCALPVFAAPEDGTEFSYDLKLCRALANCKVKAYDYALFHLDAMLARYPDKADTIRIEQARFFHLMGRRKEGDTALGQIATASPEFARAQLIGADIAKRSGQLPKAEEALARYFQKRPKPASDDADDIAEWRQAVQELTTVQISLGKAAEAAKTQRMLGTIKSGEGEDATPADDRELKLREALTILTAAQVAVDQGKPVDAAQVGAAIAKTRDVAWGPRDGLMAVSMLASAHGKLLLGQFKETIDTLKMGADVMAAVEEAMAQENRLDESPLAGAFYYYATAQVGLAEQALKARKLDEAEKLLDEAMKRLDRVQKKYRKSEYHNRSTIQLSRIKELLEKNFNRTIQVEDDGAAAVDRALQEAGAFLEAKKFEDAIPRLIEGLRGARRSSRAPEIGLRLVHCYAASGKWLEASAIASYLKDAFPAIPETADAFLNLGANLAVKAQTLKDPKDKAQRERMLAQAMENWETFVALAPAHPQAPDRAFTVAENAYRVAKEAADATKGVPEGPDRDALIAQAKKLYLQAAPKYERVIEVFPSHDRGIRSWYKLGWIYYNCDESRKAADAFLTYADKETTRDRQNDVAEAKFRAAEKLMFSGEAEEAIPHFTELLTWLQPDSPKHLDLKSDTVKRLIEDANSYLGWAYDFAGEDKRPPLKELDATVAQLKAEIEEATQRAKRAQDSVVRIKEEEVRKATDELAEMEKAVKQPAATATDLLRAAGKLESVEGKSPEEKASIEARQKEVAASIMKEAAESERKRVAGEKIGLDEQLLAVKDALAKAEQKRDALKKQLAALEATQGTQKEGRDRLADVASALQKRFDDALAVQKVAEAEFQKWKNAVEEAKANQETGDAKAKAAATQARILAAENLDKAEKALRPALLALAAEREPKKEQARQETATKLRDAQAALTDTETRLWTVKRDCAYAVKEAEIAAAQLMAAAKSIDRNAVIARNLGKPPAEEPAASERAKAFDAELTACRNALAKRTEYANLVQDYVTQEANALQQRAKEVEAKIAVLEQQRQPIQQKIDEQKKLALEQFARFIKSFPASKQVPDNLSRLGSIYLDFKQYDKAAEILNDLATKYKDHKAVKQAMFNLGRAQFESGNKEEAIKAFGQIAATAKDQSTGNLSYIAAKMLEANTDSASKLALQATRELLARSENTKHSDAGLLKKTRDRLLYNAGQAALQVKDPGSAKTYLKEMLDAFPNSAYYFDARFLLCKAFRNAAPPDLDGAIEQIRDIMDYASSDPVLQFKAMIEYSDILANKGGADNLQTAVGRLEGVLLYDPSLPGVKEYYEQALYGVATLYARLGNAAKRDEKVRLYKEKFPAGKFAAAMNQLPAADPGIAVAPQAASPAPQLPAAAPKR